MSYVLKTTENSNDIKLSQLFRSKIFRKSKNICDNDELDQRCIHYLIFDKFNSYKLVCVFRVYLIHNTNQLCNSYSNKFYKLNNLKKIQDPMLELGRFCVDPNYRDPKIIMTAWSAIRKLVEKNKIKFLFLDVQVLLAQVLIDIWIVLNFLKTKYIAPKNIIFM